MLPENVCFIFVDMLSSLLCQEKSKKSEIPLMAFYDCQSGFFLVPKLCLGTESLEAPLRNIRQGNIESWGAVEIKYTTQAIHILLQ
jgi:hypothetical protein